MSKDITMLLFMFLAIIFSGAVIKYTMTPLEPKKEGLENMQQQNFRLTPGGYPETQDKLLLNPEYPSAANESAASELAPAPVSGLPGPSAGAGAGAGPAWQFSTPDNGKCSPMIFCNTFYKERPLGERPSQPQIPEAIPVGDSRRRVGFYAADDNNA